MMAIDHRNERKGSFRLSLLRDTWKGNGTESVFASKVQTQKPQSWIHFHSLLKLPPLTVWWFDDKDSVGILILIVLLMHGLPPSFPEIAFD
jgi:hypothetical protein